VLARTLLSCALTRSVEWDSIKVTTVYYNIAMIIVPKFRYKYRHISDLSFDDSAKDPETGNGYSLIQSKTMLRISGVSSRAQSIWS
jgi:hypothetical protein